MAEAESTHEPTDTAALAGRLYKEARDHTSAWRQEAREWYDMVAGDQWDEGDLAKLKEQQRPAITFNRIQRTLNAIVGTQVANRQETRFLPRELGDIEVNEVINAAVEWVRDECDAEDEESDAFEDMSICGMGWTETHLCYERDADGMVLIPRVDALEMYWDPGASKRNLSDAEWVMRVRMFDVAEFQNRWKDADPVTSADPWESIEDDVSARTHVYPHDAYMENQKGKDGPHGRRQIRVAQLQWATRKPAYRVGKRAERIDEEGFEKLRDKFDKKGIKYLKQHQVEWRQAFIAGGEVLEEDVCPYPKGPTLKCMTFKRDRNKNTWYGIVKAMVEPQKFGNKFFSQILDILNKGAKGGVMYEADAVDDVREFEQKWAAPDGLVKVRVGALSGNKITPKPVLQLPPGLDRLMTFSMDAVHEIPGVNLELLGFANRDQPGVLETQRKRSGLTILSPLFDALRRYRKEQGRVLLYFVQTYLSDDRLVRIMGENGQEEYVPLVKQQKTLKYDVVIDEAPTSPNMKERVYSSLVEMMPVLATMGIPMPPELLDYAPIPSALAAKWKQLLGNAQSQSGQIPPELQEQIMGGMAEIERLKKENIELRERRDIAEQEFVLKSQAAEQDRLQAAEEHQARLDNIDRIYALRQREVENEMQLDELESGAKIEREDNKAEAAAHAAA